MKILIFLTCVIYLSNNVKERSFNTLACVNKVENIGVEPMTSCVQGRRSSQLS